MRTYGILCPLFTKIKNINNSGVEISDFIQLGILVVAIASIVVTHIMDA